MSGLSRRELLRASAGAAAIAVPISALSHAAGGASAASGTVPDADVDEVLAAAGSQPVMFCVHDASRGEVAILQGADEVIVRDRQLVARIMKAATSRRSV